MPALDTHEHTVLTEQLSKMMKACLHKQFYESQCINNVKPMIHRPEIDDKTCVRKLVYVSVTTSSTESTNARDAEHSSKTSAIF